MLNSRHDPATPHTWARNVTRQLDGAVLLTYDGWGHGVIDRSACTLTATTRYLVDLRPPKRGTHCAAVPPEPAPGSASPETSPETLAKALATTGATDW
ncbi:alpha/beta hydrolase [Actinophytocola sp.]|uniref:alpha/beta hydrolase n=1 Tax=Actinophytocola sp. TaxID=1872138 RepID=UPI0039C8AF3C